MKRTLLAFAACAGLLAAGPALAGQNFYIEVVNNTVSPATVSQDESNCVDLKDIKALKTVDAGATTRFATSTERNGAGLACTRFQKQLTFTVSWKANKGTALKFTQCQVGTNGWDDEKVAQAYAQERTVCSDLIKSETVRNGNDHVIKITLEE